jgi:predicted NBD/HSP70 family sugar kinase
VPALQTRSLVDTLSARLGADVFLENDATAAALGERLNGVAREAADFFYVFIGEGVGGGLVVRGEPDRGLSGNAGEFGHVVVDPRGPRCYCGNRGCLGEYLSLSSRRRAMEAHGEASEDADAAWIADAATALSVALVGVENMLDPAMVVLGGTAPSSLLARLIEEIGELRPSVRQGLGGNRLVMSGLGEHSASLGAAALPIIAATSPF